MAPIKFSFSTLLFKGAMSLYALVRVQIVPQTPFKLGIIHTGRSKMNFISAQHTTAKIPIFSNSFRVIYVNSHFFKYQNSNRQFPFRILATSQCCLKNRQAFTQHQEWHTIYSKADIFELFIYGEWHNYCNESNI